MAKRKKKIKQRKKRQLKRALKQTNKITKEVTPVKEVTPAIEIVNPYALQYPEWILPKPIDTQAKHNDKDQAFQVKLNKVYGGTVTALSHYVNNNCTMTFKCNSCGLIFFGKAGHMVGAKHQRHECGMPYSTVHGERLEYVSTARSNVKTKGGKKQAEKQAKLFNELIWQDYTYQEIAKELQVNPSIVKDYFMTEGLLEDVPQVKEGELELVDSSKFGRKAFKDGNGKLFLECTDCKAIKYCDSFGNSKNGFHGKTSKCRECVNKDQRAKG